MRRVVRCSNCAPSCASRRETEALMLDFGRASALAAAVKPPYSITQQKASTSFQSIVRYSGQCIQRTQFISRLGLPRLALCLGGCVGPETDGFLMNCWYVAAWDAELIDGKLLARTIMEKPLLLYRGDSGKVVALDNRCCHRGAKLSNGRREGDDIRCMYHGLKFDPSGKCIQIPGQDNIPKGLGVRSYPVVERQTLVWIWMGDPAKADPAKIVDIPYLANPAWRGKQGYMHYDAHYLLIVDNLSDFAHLAFVHTKTLGGSEDYAYQTKPAAIERLEDGFRVERWHMNADCPPFHKKEIGRASCRERG